MFSQTRQLNSLRSYALSEVEVCGNDYCCSHPFYSRGIISIVIPFQLPMQHLVLIPILQPSLLLFPPIHIPIYIHFASNIYIFRILESREMYIMVSCIQNQNY